MKTKGRPASKNVRDKRFDTTGRWGEIEKIPGRTGDLHKYTADNPGRGRALPAQGRGGELTPPPPQPKSLSVPGLVKTPNRPKLPAKTRKK